MLNLALLLRVCLIRGGVGGRWMLNIACDGLAVKTNKVFFHSVMSLGPVGVGWWWGGILGCATGVRPPSLQAPDVT